MAEYTSAINLAARLIIKKGRVVTFRRVVSNAAAKNPDRPFDKPAGIVTDTDYKMVFLDFEQKDINGTDILTGDKQVFMFAKGVPFAPTRKDKIIEKPTATGQQWNIMEVEILKPGEEDVLYILQVRR